MVANAAFVEATAMTGAVVRTRRPHHDFAIVTPPHRITKAGSVEIVLPQTGAVAAASNTARVVSVSAAVFALKHIVTNTMS